MTIRSLSSLLTLALLSVACEDKPITVDDTDTTEDPDDTEEPDTEL